MAEASNDLYEKVGKLNGSVEAMNIRLASFDVKIGELSKKLDDISTSIAGLKVRVATISGAIGMVGALVAEFVWSKLSS